jgi:hypothetical protein
LRSQPQSSQEAGGSQKKDFTTENTEQGKGEDFFGRTKEILL